jgi:hypothetical protein
MSTAECTYRILRLDLPARFSPPSENAAQILMHIDEIVFARLFSHFVVVLEKFFCPYSLSFRCGPGEVQNVVIRKHLNDIRYMNGGTLTLE